MIRRCFRWTAVALLVTALGPTISLAQDSGPTPWGLFSVRYDTRTSDFIYAAYGYGRTFAMVGALENPRSGYTELLGAVGRSFAIGDGPSHFVAVGAARADDLWYAQLYYLPTIHLGDFWMRATTEWYFPFTREGALQFSVSPVSVTRQLTRLVEIGVAADLATSRGEKSSIAAGPELRVALPKAVLGTDVQQMLNSNAKRLRIFFITAF